MIASGCPSIANASVSSLQECINFACDNDANIVNYNETGGTCQAQRCTTYDWFASSIGAIGYKVVAGYGEYITKYYV